MSAHWTLLMLAAAALCTLRRASALPAPAYLSTGVAVGEDTPALAYAGAGTFQNGIYTAMYDNMGDGYHNFWPLEGLWSSAEPTVWQSTNAFSTNWKPSVRRRAVPTYRMPIDLRTGYRCVWGVRPGDASAAVAVGSGGCISAQDQTGGHAPREMPAPPPYQGDVEAVVPENDAAGAAATTSLPPRLGEAAQLVMRQADDPVAGEDMEETSSSRSRRRRQVPRQGRRGAGAAAAAASASSGPWGASASAASSSAATGGRGRPAYGYRPGYYGRRPVYGRPYPGMYYG